MDCPIQFHVAKYINATGNGRRQIEALVGPAGLVDSDNGMVHQHGGMETSLHNKQGVNDVETTFVRYVVDRDHDIARQHMASKMVTNRSRNHIEVAPTA